MTESVEHYKPIAEKRYNRKAILMNDGDVFVVNGKEYFVRKNINNVFYGLFYGDMDVPVNDQHIISIIHKQIEQDENIKLARTKIADVISNNDRVLAEVLRMHLKYTRGKIENPIRRKNIDFYQVGHNASHNFYAGTKCGKRFALSMLPEAYEYDFDELVKNENEDSRTLEAQEYIYEVEEGDWGYMGHG
jgi:hypothetical protein